MRKLWDCDDCGHTWLGGSFETSCPNCGSTNVYPRTSL